MEIRPTDSIAFQQYIEFPYPELFSQSFANANNLSSK